MVGCEHWTLDSKTPAPVGSLVPAPCHQMRPELGYSVSPPGPGLTPARQVSTAEAVHLADPCWPKEGDRP